MGGPNLAQVSTN